MTAEEARKISNSITNTKAANILRIINRDIQLAAEMGKTSITVYQSIPLPVRENLRVRGFELFDSPDPRDGGCTTISW